MSIGVGSAAAGYGFEYVASTLDRVRGAALSQNDNMLQMPIVTPVADDAWSVKESVVSEEDFPEWGPRENRGVQMEVSTAAACLAQLLQELGSLPEAEPAQRAAQGLAPRRRGLFRRRREAV